MDAAGIEVGLAQQFGVKLVLHQRNGGLYLIGHEALKRGFRSLIAAVAIIHEQLTGNPRDTGDVADREPTLFEQLELLGILRNDVGVGGVAHHHHVLVVDIMLQFPSQLGYLIGVMLPEPELVHLVFLDEDFHLSSLGRILQCRLVVGGRDVEGHACEGEAGDATVHAALLHKCVGQMDDAAAGALADGDHAARTEEGDRVAV